MNLKNLKAIITKKLDEWFPMPQEPKRRRAAKKRAAKITVTYDEWKRGKMGYGPAVAAPRGYGKEWSARLYCERRIDRAKYYAQCDWSKKNFRTGSYNHRRRATVKQAKRQAWEYGIEMATAVVTASDGYWVGKKELVKEIFDYTSFMLDMAGD